ncbi:MAG TPA: anaerobic sulfite reductase subunit AsrA [Tissierellales bacterium]|nr:anaerobic sulfite reductase subunit AsrA [Tissierellales bacterium]
MGVSLRLNEFNDVLCELKKDYVVYAPKVFKNKGRFSDTDLVRYDEISSIEEIEFNKKTYYSPKEVLIPITQTLFYFTEDKVTEPEINEKKILVFLRSCDIHAVKRLDEIYLNNGNFEDPYYKQYRERVKFILMECEKSFENCFCVSMKTNKTDNYSMFIKREDDNVLIKVKDDEFSSYFDGGIDIEVSPKFVEENEIEVKIPDNLNTDIFDSPMWKEYTSRCIACGRCNTVCGTCSCFSMQDIFYSDNENVGERRRVWASCQIDGYSEVAGGFDFRGDQGDRMRFKVMHKIYDFNKRFGYHMCVGCGRCDDACPEYISFSNCVNKLNNEVKEGR